jgi:hypothetical protein
MPYNEEMYKTSVTPKIDNIFIFINVSTIFFYISVIIRIKKCI